MTGEPQHGPPRPSALRRVDDALVPILQGAARGIGSTVARPFRAVARWEDRSWFRVVVRHRGVLAFVAVALATTGSAVHFDRYPELRAADAAAQRQDLGPAGGDDRAALPAGAQAVGPRFGSPVADYVADRHEALLALDPGSGDTLVAVVSFETYLDPRQVLEVLPDGTTVELAQYRLPAQGEPPLETEVVRGDLAGSIERALDAALDPIREEESEVAKLLESDTVDEPEFEAEYERRLSELRSMRNVIETGAPVVFAVVVEGPVGALQGLLGAQHVRVVDPAPSGTVVAESVFFGVRPEDTDRATYGRDG